MSEDANAEKTLLAISGLQHFAFCRRQWALIHVEQQWLENTHTAQGRIFHSKAHDETKTEVRGDTLITRGLRVSSERLGLTGVCDVVEFHASPEGVPIVGHSGKWVPVPIEYKKGRQKTGDNVDIDALQLCAQAMCLEEMLCIHIPQGFLFYGETRRRQCIVFDCDLREKVRTLVDEMKGLMDKGHTPAVKWHKGCDQCSLLDVCCPKASSNYKVENYIDNQLRESP